MSESDGKPTVRWREYVGIPKNERHLYSPEIEKVMLELEDLKKERMRRGHQAEG